MKKFEFVFVSENLSHIVGEVNINFSNLSFVVSGGMSNKVKGKIFAEYLPNKITVANGDEPPRPIWYFQAGDGTAYLRDYNGEPFIVIVNKAIGVTQAMSLYDLATRPIVMMKGEKVMAGVDIGKVIEVKQAVAREFKMEPSFTGTETEFVTMLGQLQQQIIAEARIQAQDEARARHEDQMRKRAELRAAILKRPHVYAFTSNGVRRHGTPVVNDDEWKMLKDGTPVVLVKSYENGVASEVIEAFFVSKKQGGGTSKENPTPVTSNFTSSHEVAVEVLGKKIFLLDGSPRMLDVYGNHATINQLRKCGLNSGTLVACPVENDLGLESPKFTVYRVTERQSATVGVYAPFTLNK